MHNKENVYLVVLNAKHVQIQKTFVLAVSMVYQMEQVDAPHVFLNQYYDGSACVNCDNNCRTCE